MNSPHEVTINIDNRTLAVPKGLTILEVARRNEIYIPTLCAHKDLTPFGGCRMCIVEVEKMRGLPTACTTPVEEGMVIRTETAQVHAVRLEILQLILSEHTSSCLICDEKEECKRFSTTIRKAGVTTGCRYCPNDSQCELQLVADKMGLKEIGYPIYYRNLPVEKDDPFFDRDYNLCILCGRCVRMCQDVRTAGTLAFAQRGRQTIIGPAFHRSHIDAGCEFCGACVSVCPTGALSERAGKWEGKPDREETTTCALCGIGCQTRLQVKGQRVIGSLPAEDPLINHGQLCVKGRFCIPELVNGYQRLVRPFRTENSTQAMLSWEEAVELAAKRLEACAPDEFGMLISPDCCTEDLYVAQKFVRTAMRSHRIDTSARSFYGSAFDSYLRILKKSQPLAELKNASVILCLGFDGRFGASVVGVELRKATRNGAKVVTMHPRDHSVSVLSERWIQPIPGMELESLRTLVDLTRAEAGAVAGSANGELRAGLSETASLLRAAPAAALLVGSEFLKYDAAAEILATIEQLALNTGAGIVAVPAHSNLLGTIMMGAYAEFLPGGMSSSDEARRLEVGRQWGVNLAESSSPWHAGSISAKNKLKVLYVVGEVITNLHSLCEFSIFQNIYPPEFLKDADLVLPAAAFSEVEGTFFNFEGRVQRVARAVAPPGEALPDWQIICRIARKMRVPGFDFASVADIRDEIATLVPEFAEFKNGSRERYPMRFGPAMQAAAHEPVSRRNRNGSFPCMLSASVADHSYRGFRLTAFVGGAKELFSEGVALINARDAENAGISTGDSMVLTGDDFERILPAQILEGQPEGFIHAVLHPGEMFNPNPLPVRIRKSDV
ncbi:MAG: molybdopterin-dependent oxidoreductase [Acidobacteriota bacterium]|jgi:predicted molibdopterin-dependent oxidoreductase YjgC